MKIDMGRKGPLGIELTLKNGVAYIGGTNHWLEWLHHFIPGAAWREKRWARDVAEVIRESGQMTHTIAGHSVGGTIAIIVTYIGGWVVSDFDERTRELSLDDYYKCYTYGAKRPPRGYYCSGKHYRIKGDPVPFVTPWRKGLPLITLDYGKLGPVEAHGPRSYWEQMTKDGVR